MWFIRRGTSESARAIEFAAEAVREAAERASHQAHLIVEMQRLLDEDVAAYGEEA